MDNILQEIIDELEIIRERRQYDAERCLHQGNEFMEYGYNCEISGIDKAIHIIESKKQLNNNWISVSERLPQPKEWCWIWFDYGDDSGEGFCEKMFLNSKRQWMRNAITTVKDEYAECIKAWQPYYEPEPYKSL